jgi:hypothetical protein
MTPIIVAVVQELLMRPADTVSAETARRSPGGAVILERQPDPEPEEPFDPLAPVTAEELEALPETTTQRTSHRRSLTPRQWKLALVTGLIAFAGAVFVITAGELLAGDNVSGGSGSTTFFSGANRHRDATPAPTATATPEAEEETPEPTPTPTPSATPAPTDTPPPTVTPAPESTVAPQSEAPAASPTPAP